MIYLLIALASLALVHFVYESIIAPSLRLGLRFRLFALRDQVRKLKIDCGSDLGDRHFYYLQDSINTLLSVFYRFDLAALWTIDRKLQSDSELRKRTETRANVLNDCKIPEARLIQKKCTMLAVQAVAVNNGIWAILATPFLIAAWGLGKLKLLIRQSISLSETDIQKTIPPSTVANSVC